MRPDGRETGGWLDVTVTVPRTLAAAVEAFLEAAGAACVTIEDAAGEPILDEAAPQPPQWSTQRITGLFAGDADGCAIANALCLLFDLDRGSLQEHHFADRNWEQASREAFHPIAVGRRLCICPSWCEPPDPHAVNVILDPGPAFGTGSHPTTALCLEALEALGPGAVELIDYGCGSGILAIAGLRLGARRAVAVDVDPWAIANSCENAARNRVGDRFVAILADEYQPQPADVVIANILSHTLIDLAPTLSALVRDGGHLILSGLLPGQVDRVVSAYLRFRFERRVRDEWVALVGRHR